MMNTTALWHRCSLLPVLRSGSVTRLLSTSDKIQYVHPLSQLVLDYLQDEKSNWTASHGLNQGVEVGSDGTFVIKFPSYNKDNARIWTSFDNNEKKHWLTVHKGELVGRFMLQDNLKPAWNDAKSTPEKIRSAVDAMIDKINEESERSK